MMKNKRAVRMLVNLERSVMVRCSPFTATVQYIVNDPWTVGDVLPKVNYKRKEYTAARKRKTRSQAVARIADRTESTQTI